MISFKLQPQSGTCGPGSKGTREAMLGWGAGGLACPTTGVLP